MDFGWLTGQKVSEWPTMFKHFGGFKNRADGYILRNRIQMQQKPQRRNSFTLRLNGCRADFQNRNIRVCCMDTTMRPFCPQFVIFRLEKNAMAKTKAEEKALNLDQILFNCRVYLRAARNSGSFFEKRDIPRSTAPKFSKRSWNR